MVPKCYTTLDMAAIQQAGIAAVQNIPGLELSGEGVLVGIIDTGINYLDPIFRNLDGSTRIQRIWDQEEQSGTAPRGIGYGSEYTKEQINQAILSENPKETVPSLIRTDMALLLQVWHAEGQIRRICLSGQRRRQRW